MPTCIRTKEAQKMYEALKNILSEKKRKKRRSKKTGY